MITCLLLEEDATLKCIFCHTRATNQTLPSTLGESESWVCTYLTAVCGSCFSSLKNAILNWCRTNSNCTHSQTYFKTWHNFTPELYEQQQGEQSVFSVTGQSTGSGFGPASQCLYIFGFHCAVCIWNFLLHSLINFVVSWAWCDWQDLVD